MGLKKQKQPDEKPANADGALKKKSLICSTEAAIISIVIHLLLLGAAGSWVAVKYVQKKKAELTAYTAPPKMERRQLSAPMKKMERVRQTSQRPKIVSSRAAVTPSEFSMPAVAAAEAGSTQKFTTPFADSGRDFSFLTKGLTFEIPSFRFLGVRASGEKLAFIIEASPEMLADHSGGEAACDHIKQELNELLAEMSSSVLFNVFLYNGSAVASFRPQMTAVTRENVAAFEEWMAPALSSVSPQGLMLNTYEPDQVYDTAIGDEVSSWARAMQAALEQRPDTVFVVGRDWGYHGIGPEKGRRLIEFSLWETLYNPVRMHEALQDDRDMRDHYIVEAVEVIKDEEKRLRRERKPVPFLRSLIDYMQYSADQILDHIDVICDQNYASVKQTDPQVHFVRLVAADDMKVADSSSSKIRRLVRSYNGELKFLNGTHIRGARSAEEEEELVVSEPDDAAESEFRFFSRQVTGSRVVFVLDVSEELFAPGRGGTTTMEWLKERVVRSVRSLEAETKFNVLACNEERVAVFRPEMQAGVDAAELQAWLESVQRGLDLPAASTAVYETGIGADIKGVPLALQVAMEQRADTILVSGPGIGQLKVDPEKARRLLDFSIFHALGDPGEDTEPASDLMDGSSDGMLRVLKADQDLWRSMVSQALDCMEEDARRMKEARIPLGFARNISDFVQYTPEQLLDHLETVAASFYPRQRDRIALPQIHFAKVMDPEAKTERKQFDEFRAFMKVYESDVQLISGPDMANRKRQREMAETTFSGLPQRKRLIRPQFRFMDVRGNGKKLIFILDVSTAMLSDDVGGVIACNYIKQELHKLFLKLPDAVQFNVILYDGDTVMALHPQMRALDSGQRQSLDEWLTPVLSKEYAGLKPEQNTYEPQIDYETDLERGAAHWAKAMQAALEQRPDMIFIIGRDWGRHDISPAKAQDIMEFSLWKILGGSGNASITETSVLEEDRRVLDGCVLDAVDLIVREGKEQEGRVFLHDLPKYMQYSRVQIVEHLQRVCLRNYLPVEESPPQVNWVRLVSEEDSKRSDMSTRNMRRLVRSFNGSFAFLDGEEIRDKYAGRKEEEEAVEVELSGDSSFTFFGTDVESSSIIFVLDVSEKMFDEDTGAEVAFEFIKGQIAQMVRELGPNTVFNVLACNEERIVAFAPEMGRGFATDELDAWFEKIERGLEVESVADLPVNLYRTAIGKDIKGLPLAVQMAMEQQPQTILVAEAGMGNLPVEREKARRLLNFAILQKLGARGSELDDEEDFNDDEQDTAGAMVSPLKNDSGQFRQLMSQAIQLMAEENEKREEERLPLGFVRDIFDYIEYTPAHIFDHLLTVGKAVYPQENDEVKLPQIHFARLIEADDRKKERRVLRDYRSFRKTFQGEVQLIRGASSGRELRELNRSLDLYNEY